MRPVGRDAFAAAKLQAFRGATGGGNDEEGRFAGQVGNIADLLAVRRPAGGGFNIAVIREAFRLVGREIVAVKVHLVAKAEGEADELAVAGKGGGTVEAARGRDDPLDAFAKIHEHNVERIVLGERIDHGVGVAPAGLRGDGVVLREDFETRAVEIDRANFAAVLGVGDDERDFAVAEALDIEQLSEDVINDKAGSFVNVRGLFLAADGFAVALQIQSELRVVTGGLDFENRIFGLLFGHDFEPSGKR